MRVCLPYCRLTGPDVTHNPRLLRSSLRRVKFYRPFHSLLTIRVLRRLQDSHLIALSNNQFVVGSPLLSWKSALLSSIATRRLVLDATYTYAFLKAGTVTYWVCLSKPSNTWPVLLTKEVHRQTLCLVIDSLVALQRFNVPTLPFLHPTVRVGPPLTCALTRSANLGLELLVQWLATSIYPTPPRGG